MDENSTEGRSTPSGLTKKDVLGYKDLIGSLAIDHQSQVLISNLFGEEALNLFSEKGGRRHLADSFLSLAFDRGLRREFKFKGEEIKPVLMFGRTTGISWFKEKIGLKQEEGNEIGFSNKNSFKILKLDIANVFAANKIDNGLGGDYLINKVAGILREVTENFSYGEDKAILPVRYGGDEFIIFLTGDWQLEVVDQLIVSIKNQINNKQAYFNFDNKEEERPIQIKNDEIEIIDFSNIKEENKRQLFFAFLNNGQILGLEELEKEYNQLMINNKFKIYLEEAMKKNIYPPDIKSNEEKIEYLLSLHPEFKVPFYLAQYLDKKEGERGSTRQDLFLRFVESYLIDPLLDRVVLTRFDLPSHLMRDKFKEIFSFEIKMKELNEHPNLGYAYADRVIIELWNNLKREIGEDLINKIAVGRFGGTIFLGLKEGQKIESKIIDRLKKMSIEVDGIAHHVGFSHVLAPLIEENDSKKIIEEKITRTMEIIFDKPTIDWLIKSFSWLIEDEERQKHFIDALEKGSKTDNNSKMESELDLLIRYFLGKRRGTRIKTAKKVLSELPDDKYEELKNFFQAL